ncbi:phage major capsid protein [Lactococcus hircilactis]|uniref:Phage major capsid protein n=1 Tax=Lactococcus hircilactis TaxID=1494462 RepID=A0A7X1ZA12_9LACT|nr:phage major capsid protein [Lactococcus hircilactis]MQW40616.1 phage major capsid protein [Lactococcus hircilactis]
MKIEKLKKDLATKTAELNTKKAEIRSFTDSEDKTIDEVKAGMAEIKEKEDEIKEIRSNIEVLEQASALKVEEKRDESDLADHELEENSSDNKEDDPEKTKTEEKLATETGKKPVKDEEKRDAGGLQDMKLKVGGETADKKVTAFADYLKTGEVRDVTGIALKDGKVIIPETILTPEKEVHQFPRLGSLVRTESVTTTTGKLPIFNNSTDLLTAHTEYGQTTKNATPVITPILWDLQTYTGGYVFSQELISDSSYDWQAELQSRLTELRDNTDDSLIITALTDGITKAASTDLLGDIKKVLNVTFKPQDSAAASIVMSQSAYNAFDMATDAMGRPLLQPNVTAATGYTLLGKTVVIVDDTLFPKAKAGDVNIVVAPLKKAVINFKLTEITGQFQDTYDIWYKQLGIFLRENVVQARKDLIVNLTGTLKAVTVVPTQAG